jgi:hypothetical protein
MSYLEHLPERIADHIRSRFVCEFATVSRAGVPINSPLVPFASADLRTIDAATGLAYPAKAERIRRNPKIGMLFEGGPDDPVVSISAMGAVRDRDFQANLERYLAEEILTPAISPQVVDYQALTRQAIWYFTRILICATPVVIRWWDSRAGADLPPQEWRAPPGSAWPPSDPAPAGAPSPSPWAPAASWREIAARALGRGAEAHLTLVDPEGFPLPVRVRAVRPSAEGFRLTLPAWLPWRGGEATLSFEGIEVIAGQADIDGREMAFRAERPLPMHPLIADPGQLLAPSPANKQALLERIDIELARRGLSRRPEMPAEPPEPTAGARLRAKSAFDFRIAGLAAG